MSHYPRVLVVALGRINAKDSYNNGLFLRSLFGECWPKTALAQIYSSGDTGDCGFFGSYYCLGARDRHLGSIFYKKKAESKVDDLQESNKDIPLVRSRWKAAIKRNVLSLAVDTGLYELVFRPCLSDELLQWARAFKPDVILAQGYNLSFTWLPVMLKRELGCKLAVITTDDWPKYLYSGLLGEPKIFSPVVRPIVERAARRLFKEANYPFAFGAPMAKAYEERYRRKFVVINHSDDPKRFNVDAVEYKKKSAFTLMAIGAFNKFRLPLLFDAAGACEALRARGVDVRLVVLSSFIETAAIEALRVRNVDVLSDPGGDGLPAYLGLADAFLLAESFDPGFVEAIELSVSTKAHLFMFSRRPIVVYADRHTGIAKYATEFGWADVVQERSEEQLASRIEVLLCDSSQGANLVRRGAEVALEHHTLSANQMAFRKVLSS